MNNFEMKKTEINLLEINDSLNLPLLEFNLYINENIILFPNEELEPSEVLFPISNQDQNELEIIIKGSKKTRVLTYMLNEPLSKIDSVFDEFVIKPSFNDANEIEMKAYVIRRIKNNTILENEVIEEIAYKPVELFSGFNQISTNYENVKINVTYPKANDLNQNYVSNASFDKLKQDWFETLTSRINLILDNTDLKHLNLTSLNVECLRNEKETFHVDKNGNLNSEKIITPELDTDFITTNQLLIHQNNNADEYQKSILEVIEETKVTKDEKGLYLKSIPEMLRHDEKVNLYHMIILMWKAMQEILSKLKQIEGE